MWIAKLNGTTGATMAAKAFGTKGSVEPAGLATDSLGNVIAVGSLNTGVAFGSTTFAAPAGQTEAFAVKLDTNLVPSWARHWGGPAGAGAGQGMWISWPVSSGKSYYVQFKNNPSDPIWQTLGGSVTIVGTQGYFYDLAPGSSQRFYRVVAQ